jgi:F-type H+-transporting ATPase subunit gamma
MLAFVKRLSLAALARHETREMRLAPVQVCGASMKELRDRIDSVQNTKKITEAMKLVAAAKVRRAQDAVVNGRPFAENLVKVRAAAKQTCFDQCAMSELARCW